MRFATPARRSAPLEDYYERQTTDTGTGERGHPLWHLRADGTLDHYEYLRREDAPTVEGTPLSKANLLSDATASKLWPAATNRRTQLSTRHLKSYRRVCTSSAISS